MTIRSRGPAAGLGWLARGISVPFNHPKASLGGAAILMAAALMPSVIMLPMRWHAHAAGTPPSMSSVGWLMAASLLFGLLLAPLYGGYLQMIDAAERGLPVRVLDIFKPYRSSEALRLIGYRAVVIALYLAVLGAILMTVGRGVFSWYRQILMMQSSHQLPFALPHGFGITIALCCLLGFFLMGFYAVGLGQLALRGRNVFGAVGDGLVGAAKNILPLMVFMLSYFVALILLFVVLFIAILVIIFVAKLVGMWLMAALMVVIYGVVFMMMFALMFGVSYHLWRDVCGDDNIIGTPPAFAA